MTVRPPRERGTRASIPVVRAKGAPPPGRQDRAKSRLIRKAMSVRQRISLEEWKAMPDTRPSAALRGYGRRWRKWREQILLEEPECRVCGKGATVVDHIVPHRGDMGLFWDRENCQALCAPCHDMKTLVERR